MPIPFPGALRRDPSPAEWEAPGLRKAQGQPSVQQLAQTPRRALGEAELALKCPFNESRGAGPRPDGLDCLRRLLQEPLSCRQKSNAVGTPEGLSTIHTVLGQHCSSLRTGAGQHTPGVDPKAGETGLCWPRTSTSPAPHPSLRERPPVANSGPARCHDRSHGRPSPQPGVPTWRESLQEDEGVLPL